MSRRWPFAPLATLLVIQPRRKRGRCGDRRGVIATISRCEMLELFLRLTGTQQSGWHRNVLYAIEDISDRGNIDRGSTAWQSTSTEYTGNITKAAKISGNRPC